MRYKGLMFAAAAAFAALPAMTAATAEPASPGLACLPLSGRVTSIRLRAAAHAPVQQAFVACRDHALAADEIGHRHVGGVF